MVVSLSIAKTLFYAKLLHLKQNGNMLFKAYFEYIFISMLCKPHGYWLAGHCVCMVLLKPVAI
jgi:hypothetical protein